MHHHIFLSVTPGSNVGDPDRSIIPMVQLAPKRNVPRTERLYFHVRRDAGAMPLHQFRELTALDLANHGVDTVTLIFSKDSKGSEPPAELLTQAKAALQSIFTNVMVEVA